MRLRLLDQLERHARDNPGAIAVADSEGSISRGELFARVQGWSAHLAASHSPGEVVLLCTPNRLEFTIAFLAILSAGLRAFPVSPELSGVELSSVAERSRAALVIATPLVVHHLLGRVKGITIDDINRAPRTAIIQRAHDSAGLLLLSSGTTGRPKIVFRDADALDAVSAAMAESISFAESDRVLACVPLGHSYGIEHGVLAPVWAGSGVVLHQGFQLNAVLRALDAQRITIFPGVPFMFEMLAQHGRRFPSLRRAYSAGGPLPRRVAGAFHCTFGLPVSQLYGATEIGSVTYADPDLPGFDPATVGRAMTGVSIRILDPNEHGEGHVAIRAASMLQGYLGEGHGDREGNDDASAALALPTVDGYFLTGDLGRLDSFGNLCLTGRIRLLIDVGGLKVNPLEVEDVLLQHPGVSACVVVPVQVSATVSRVKAIVTPRAGDTPPLPDSLRRFARERLASYKVPRVIEIRDSLPTSATGKILRHQVQA